MDLEPDNSASGEETKIVRIRLFATHEAAALAASNLEGHGIKCWVDSDDCAGSYPNLTAAAGVSLSVLTSDTEAAAALLKTQATPEEISQIETESTVAPPPEQTRKLKYQPIQIFSGIGIGIFLCLFCQQIEKTGTKYYYRYTSDGKNYEAFTYENGHMVETVRDRNLDGKWDAWIYYENGHVIRAEYDNNFDGKPDEWITYSNASPVVAEEDTDFNGVPGYFITYTNGMIQQMEIKPNGSTFATQRWIYQNGVLTEILRGGDSNGNFKEVVRYDPFFEPVSTNKFNLLTPPSP